MFPVYRETSPTRTEVLCPVREGRARRNRICLWLQARSETLTGSEVIICPDRYEPIKLNQAISTKGRSFPTNSVAFLHDPEGRTGT